MVRTRDVNMVVSKLIQAYGQGTFIILLGLLVVTQVHMEVTYVMVRTRNVNMVGSKLFQSYGQGTFITLLGLLIVSHFVIHDSHAMGNCRLF